MDKNNYVTNSPEIIVSSVLPENRDDDTLVIGTHSGTFHADEVVAISLYSFTKPYKKIYVVRTRDKEILSKCDISVDYGGSEYDHHRPGYTEQRENNGTKFASAGLVFSHKKLGFAEQIINNFFNELDPMNSIKNQLIKSGYFEDTINSLDSELKILIPTLKKSIIDEIDNKIIIPVDARDTGEKLNPPREDILDFIPSFNPSWCESNSSNDYNAKFQKALTNTRSILKEKIKDTISSTYKMVLPPKVQSKLGSNTSPIVAQDLLAHSLLSFVPQQDESSNSLTFNANNPDDIWNNYKEQIISNFTFQINPVESISNLYENFTSDSQANEQYSSISHIIRERLESKENEIRSLISSSIYNELINPTISDSSGEKAIHNPLSFATAFNPTLFEYEPNIQDNIDNARKVSISILEEKIKEIISREYAKETIKALYENPSFFSDGILELPMQSIPWKEAVCDLNNLTDDPNKIINYVIFPYPDGGWAAQAVPPSLDKEFEKRFPLLKEATSELKESNPKLWVHPGEFFARFAETKEDAIKLCKSSKEIQKKYLDLVDSWKWFYDNEIEF